MRLIINHPVNNNKSNNVTIYYTKNLKKALSFNFFSINFQLYVLSFKYKGSGSVTGSVFIWSDPDPVGLSIG